MIKSTYLHNSAKDKLSGSLSGWIKSKKNILKLLTLIIRQLLIGSSTITPQANWPRSRETIMNIDFMKLENKMKG